MKHQDFTAHGVHDAMKGAFHGALLAIAAPIWIFNVVAWRRHRDARHAVNAVTLTWVIGLEMVNLVEHCRHGHEGVAK